MGEVLLAQRPQPTVREDCRHRCWGGGARGGEAGSSRRQSIRRARAGCGDVLLRKLARHAPVLAGRYSRWPSELHPNLAAAAIHAGSGLASEPPKSPLRPTRISWRATKSDLGRWIFVASATKFRARGLMGPQRLPPYLCPYSLVAPCITPVIDRQRRERRLRDLPAEPERAAAERSSVRAASRAALAIPTSPRTSAAEMAPSTSSESWVARPSASRMPSSINRSRNQMRRPSLKFAAMARTGCSPISATAFTKGHPLKPRLANVRPRRSNAARICSSGGASDGAIALMRRERYAPISAFFEGQ